MWLWLQISTLSVNAENSVGQHQAGDTHLMKHLQMKQYDWDLLPNKIGRGEVNEGMSEAKLVYGYYRRNGT